MDLHSNRPEYSPGELEKAMLRSVEEALAKGKAYIEDAKKGRPLPKPIFKGYKPNFYFKTKD